LTLTKNHGFYSGTISYLNRFFRYEKRVSKTAAVQWIVQDDPILSLPAQGQWRTMKMAGTSPILAFLRVCDVADIQKIRGLSLLIINRD